MKTHNLTVLDAGASAFPGLASAARLKVVRSNWADVESDPNLMVLVPASRLDAVASVIRSASERKALRGVLIESDVDPDMFARVLDTAKVRALKRLLSFTDLVLPTRVLNAWKIGAQGELIAKAVAVQDHLLVTSCAMENVVVPWDALPALAALPSGDRSSFEVETYGSYLHWPDHDVHVGLDAFRHATASPAARARADERLRSHDQRVGAAMRALREGANLRQADIEGLTERQIRRIEKGEVQPRVATYERLAAAHGWSVDRYLDALAEHAR